jgi:hypothetical protein
VETLANFLNFFRVISIRLCTPNMFPKLIIEWGYHTRSFSYLSYLLLILKETEFNKGTDKDGTEMKVDNTECDR